MENFFLQIVNISLTASWLILAVLLLRLLFKKAPKWLNVVLWGFVAIRLVFPFSIESALSLIPSAKPLPQDFTYTAHPYIESGIPAIDRVVNPVVDASLGTPDVLTSANNTQVASFIFSRLWIAGVVLMLFYAVVSTATLKRRLATATLFEKGVRQCEKVSSPFVLGIIRPTIYIPYSLKGSDLIYVINHEKAHIARKDHVWKPLGFVILSVYWFNPFVWASYILLCRDIEAACDEKVIKDMDDASRRAYSTALLECSVKRRIISACPVAFGENGVKTRIKDVMNYKKPAFWVVIISIVACIAVALCFLTNPKDKYERVDIIGTYKCEGGLFNQASLRISESDFFFSPNLLSSYLGYGTWEVDNDRVIFNDTGMGDVRKAVFKYDGEKLIFVERESDSGLLWHLSDGRIFSPDEVIINNDAETSSDGIDNSQTIQEPEAVPEILDEVQETVDEEPVTNIESVTGVQGLKWDDFGFDCWPLEGGLQIRDEWTEETPFWQFAAPKGTPVYAVEDGFAVGGYDYHDGNYVELRLSDANTVVRYGHLDEKLEDGPLFVEAGTQIGTVGSTGMATGPFLKIAIESNATAYAVRDPQYLVREYSFGTSTGQFEACITEDACAGAEPIHVCIRDSSGAEIWATELGTPSMGWNSYYYYTEDGRDYLIRYNPSESQGQVYYEFVMFSINENGREEKLLEYYADSIEKIPEFKEQTGPYINRSKLLISTISGVITTSDGTISVKYTPRYDNTQQSGNSTHHADSHDGHH